MTLILWCQGCWVHLVLPICGNPHMGTPGVTMDTAQRSLWCTTVYLVYLICKHWLQAWTSYSSFSSFIYIFSSQMPHRPHRQGWKQHLGLLPGMCSLQPHSWQEEIVILLLHIHPVSMRCWALLEGAVLTYLMLAVCIIRGMSCWDSKTSQPRPPKSISWPEHGDGLCGNSMGRKARSKHSPAISIQVSFHLWPLLPVWGEN